MNRIAPALVVCAGAMLFPTSVSGTDDPPAAAYYSAPLVWRGWPPPVSYAGSVTKGKCLVIRLPTEQSFYCPPG